jgi:hypothetical protein
MHPYEPAPRLMVAVLQLRRRPAQKLRKPRLTLRKRRVGQVFGIKEQQIEHEEDQVRSVAKLARVEGISDRYVSSLLPLAFLAPEIVEAIAAGRQPPELTAHCLIRTVDERRQLSLVCVSSN